MIEIRDVHVRFGTHKVLDGLSLDIPDNRISVILGRSGIGKSVLLKAILGLVPVEKGSVKIDGEEVIGISASKQRELHGRVGMLLQNGGLLDSITVYENIAFPLRYHKTASENQIRVEVERIAGLVNLDEALKLYPKDLSGGMKRRAALARAIIQKPKYLFYDEPTTGLDPATSALVEILIRRVKEELDITSLVVTHDVDMVHFLGEQIALLEDGVIAACLDRSVALVPGSPIWEAFINAREKAHREFGYSS